MPTYATTDPSGVSHGPVGAEDVHRWWMNPDGHALPQPDPPRPVDHGPAIATLNASIGRLTVRMAEIERELAARVQPNEFGLIGMVGGVRREFAGIAARQDRITATLAGLERRLQAVETRGKPEAEPEPAKRPARRR